MKARKSIDEDFTEKRKKKKIHFLTHKKFVLTDRPMKWD